MRKSRKTSRLSVSSAYFSSESPDLKGYVHMMSASLLWLKYLFPVTKEKGEKVNISPDLQIRPLEAGDHDWRSCKVVSVTLHHNSG